mgnify:CR=1 FL=1
MSTIGGTHDGVAGFFPRHKCTYVMTIATGKGAPAFKLTQSDNSLWQFQWVEWDAAAVTGDAFLKASEDAATLTGQYTASSFLNPVVKFKSSATASIFAALRTP